MNSDEKLLLFYGGIIFIIILSIGILAIVQHTSKNEACEDFGGELDSTWKECYKNGVSYRIINLEMIGFDYRVVSNSVHVEKNYNN